LNDARVWSLLRSTHPYITVGKKLQSDEGTMKKDQPIEHPARRSEMSNINVLNGCGLFADFEEMIWLGRILSLRPQPLFAHPPVTG